LGGVGDIAHRRDIKIIQNAREGDLCVEHDQLGGAVFWIATVVSGSKARAARTGNWRQRSVDDANDVADGNFCRGTR
jgi:hypothetical protein